MNSNFFNKVKARVTRKILPTHTSRPATVQHKKKIVLANRNDGLGERLCGMMNALRLADHCLAEFRFLWPDIVVDAPFNSDESQSEYEVFGHSIVSQDDMFAPEFVKEHAVKFYIAVDFQSIPTAGLDKTTVAQTSARGWYTDKAYLDTSYGASFEKGVTLSSSQAFERIHFSQPMQRAIEFARSLELKPFTALHLRSGDMVYGAPRKWGFWGNKVLNPIVAAEMCKTLKEQGKTVFVFGQDSECLTQLKDKYDVQLPCEIAREQGFTNPQQALFELVLMARAEEVICGDSGFTRSVSMIADRKPRSMFKVYSAIEYSNVTLRGLENDALQLHPMMAAYSFWQAYAFGRTLRSAPELIEIISKARALDPENLMYLIIQTALLYRMGQDAQAEALLAQCDTDDGALHLGRHPYVKQLVLRYNTPTFVHQEQFNDFIAAARRPDTKYASVFRKAIMSEQKKLGLFQ